MKRYNEKQTIGAMKTGRVLMVTYGTEEPSYALDNGIGVAAKAARVLTEVTTGMQRDLFIRPNEDGLFPGFTQTWAADIA